MRNQPRSLWLLPVMACALAALPAECATVTYSDRNSWLQQVSDSQLITFDGPAEGDVYSYNSTDGLTLNGVQFLGLFSDTAQIIHIVNANGSQPWYEWNSGAVLRGEDHFAGYERRIRVNLPSAVTAWSVDLMTGGTNLSTMTVRVNGAATYEVDTFANPQRAFFGMTSETPFEYLEFINPPGTYPMLDNFAFGTASAGLPIETPESSTFLACAAGLALFVRRFRR